MSEAQPSTAPLPRQRRTDAFLRAADFASVGAGLALLAGVMADKVGDIPGWLALTGGVAVILLIYGSVGLLRYRRNDEFTLDLWAAGTNWVFFAVILFGVFLPIGVGFYQGFTTGPDSDRRFSEWLDYWGVHFALTAFFVGLQVRRFRS